METTQSAPNSSLGEPIQAISTGPIDVGSFIKSQTTLQGYAKPKISSNYENMDKPRRFTDYGPLIDLYSNKTVNSRYLRKPLIYSLKNPNPN